MGTWRGQRAVLRQCEPRVQPRILQRGARPDNRGMDQARSVSMGGQALPFPLRESVGVAAPEAASADLDPRARQPRNGRMVREASLPIPGARDVPRADDRAVEHLCERSGPGRLPGGAREFWLSAENFPAETEEKAQELGKADL